jgi:hypothetical protein
VNSNNVLHSTNDGRTVHKSHSGRRRAVGQSLEYLTSLQPIRIQNISQAFSLYVVDSQFWSILSKNVNCSVGVLEWRCKKREKLF